MVASEVVKLFQQKEKRRLAKLKGKADNPMSDSPDQPWKRGGGFRWRKAAHKLGSAEGGGGGGGGAARAARASNDSAGLDDDDDDDDGGGGGGSVFGARDESRPRRLWGRRNTNDEPHLPGKGSPPPLDAAATAGAARRRAPRATNRK